MLRPETQVAFAVRVRSAHGRAPSRRRPTPDATPSEKSHATQSIPAPLSLKCCFQQGNFVDRSDIKEQDMGVNKTALKSPSGLLKIVALVRKNFELEEQNSPDSRRFESS